MFRARTVVSIPFVGKTSIGSSVCVRCRALFHSTVKFLDMFTFRLGLLGQSRKERQTSVQAEFSFNPSSSRAVISPPK